MKVLLRDILTNELIVELLDDENINKNLTEDQLNDLLMDSSGLDNEIEELLNDENSYISIED